ncbi:hypothetical protein [Paraburkholderia xenovorans]|uniref:hypothetical protein n=2 Tax=Paraburkholderia TaxID=1822464 RepID=UPI0038BB8C1D
MGLMMPMLIDAGKRLLIDAGERVPRVNQDENSLSVVEDNCVTRDDVFGHVLYAVAFDLDEHCGMSLASNAATLSPGRACSVTRYAAGILCRATIRMRMLRRG